MGAVAWHHYFDDTWILTDEINQAIHDSHTHSGHAMVVIGFDDDAVAMDIHGHKHHGLLTLRNSWGPYVADWGDFYMSYDYFNALAIQGYQVRPPENSEA